MPTQRLRTTAVEFGLCHASFTEKLPHVPCGWPNEAKTTSLTTPVVQPSSKPAGSESAEPNAAAGKSARS